MSAQTSPLDHLVVVAGTLAEGVAWCEATLGLTPGPGGEHALMGTHNRLFKIATPAFPSAYFEIIAINPAAVCQRPPGTRRWFDMDAEDLQAQVRRHGPQLACAVAQVADLAQATASLATLGVDAGRLVPFSRQAAQGLLQWQMAVRDDGQRLLGGSLPTLIQWGSAHPALNMPASGVTLQALSLSHPQPALLAQALASAGLSRLTPHPITPGPAGLHAVLLTPKGSVTLSSAFSSALLSALPTLPTTP